MVAFSPDVPPALDRASLDVGRGDWIALVGANGSGKTTLLSAIGGVLPLSSGTIEGAGPVRTALLLQEPDNQFVATSVRHELELSVPVEIDPARRRARIDEAVGRFKLARLLERNPHRLSGGEKQRLALATVWLEDPELLLLDEPVAYLDRETRVQVVDFVRELNARGVAVVWATPGGGDVSLARTAVVLDRGRIVFKGRAADCPSDLPSDSSGPGEQEQAAPRRVPAARGTARVDRRQDPRSPDEGDPRIVLRLESVCFAYGDAPVLQDVSLEVSRGECVGVLGRNSAGKSTLLLLAGGALKPASGRVLRDAVGSGALYLPQSPERLFFAETVGEEISFGLERRGVPRAAARERALAALREVSLDPDVFSARPPFQLSVGEMRRVAFAIAASLEPGLLLLDEPASCLDREGLAVLDSLVRARQGAGAGVVVASHDETHLARLCDRVIPIGAPAAR